MEVWTTDFEDEEVRKPTHGPFVVKDAGRCLMVKNSKSSGRSSTIPRKACRVHTSRHTVQRLPYSRCFSSSAKHGCFFSIKTDTFCFSITIQFYPLQIQEIKEVSPFVKVPSKRNKYRKIMIHGAEWLQKIIIHMVMLKSDQTLLHSKATPTLVAKKPKFRRLKLKYNFKQTPKSYNRNQIYNLNQKI
ncbi:hypothetical protein LXL04_020938 [Taraxacum kok-saghyz]